MALEEALQRSLRALSHDQLREVQTYVRGLLSAPEGATVSATSPGPTPTRATSHWINQVFATECQHIFGVDFINDAVFAIVRRYHPSIIAYLDKGEADQTLVVRRAIVSAGITLLYKDMLEHGQSTSPRRLALNLTRIPAVIDRHFPGYAAGGILRMIINQGVRP